MANLTDELKTIILAKFFARAKNEDDPHLDILLLLEEYWNEKYQKNRIRLSFEAARVLANECVIEKVLLCDTELQNLLKQQANEIPPHN